MPSTMKPRASHHSKMGDDNMTAKSHGSSSANHPSTVYTPLPTRTTVVSSSSTRDSGVSVSSDSTNKTLNFDHSMICGRQKELSTLSVAVNSMIPGRRQKEGQIQVQGEAQEQQKTDESHNETIHQDPEQSTNVPSTSTTASTASPSTATTTMTQTDSKRKKHKQLVLISGYSGTGKSVLAHSVQRIVENEMGGTFVTGKFDQCLGGENLGDSNHQQQQQPYTAFRMIFDRLVREIVAMKMAPQESASRKLFEELKDQLMMELGTELMDLIHIFPSLDGLLSTGLDQSLGDGSRRIDTFANGGTTSSFDPSDGQRYSSGNVNTEAQYKFKHIFGVLFRIMASVLSPLVLVIDDLQWADTASLDLMEGLLSNPEVGNLIVIGIYRSNEVTETHLLSKTLRDIRSMSEETNTKNDLSIIEMEIGNLDLEAVHEMVSTLLSLSSPFDKDRVLSLAEICYKKTAGNPFYLTHFISRLHGMRMLKYDYEMMDWTWSQQRIELYTEATENVVDLLKQTMTSLSADHQTLLRFAAFLGSVFEKRPMLVLWKDFHMNGRSIDIHQRQRRSGLSSSRRGSTGSKRSSMSRRTDGGNDEEGKEDCISNFEEVLKSCQKAGFWELSEDGQTYRWVHDKIQEAAMDLVDSKERRDFSQYVAEVLTNRLTGKELELLMFVLVDRFNGGNFPRKRSKRIELAQLNLRAAEKAVSYSAFESAASYCKYGVRLLPKDCWDREYELSLNLYSLGAETEGFLGHVHVMEEYCNAVLRQKEVVITDAGTKSRGRLLKGAPKVGDRRRGGVRDKFRVHTVMILSTGNRDVPSEAVKLCTSVLGQYGIRFPKTTVGITCKIGMGILRLKSILKSYSAKDIEDLPMMDNAVVMEQMGLLDKMSTYCYMARGNLYPLIAFKLLDLTLEYGYCKYSSMAFGIVALILCGPLGDLAGSRVCAEYAMILLNKLNPAEARDMESRTLLFVYAFTLHWTSPARSLLAPMLRGYEVGMQCGDTENAMVNLVFYLFDQYASGIKLELIERDCKTYSLQMKKLKRNFAFTLCSITWQVILNLMGESQFKTRLTGKALKEDICREEVKENPPITDVLNLSKVIVCSFYGEYECATEYGYKHGDSPLTNLPGMPFIPLYSFHRCLSLLARARILKENRTNKKGSGNDSDSNGKRQGEETKYVKLAKKVSGKIKNWVDQGHPQSRHYEPLLEAELAAYQGHAQLAREKYGLAVEMALDDEFTQDVALANERYGIYLLSQCADAGTDDNKNREQEAAAPSSYDSKNDNDDNDNDDDLKQEAMIRLEESMRWYRDWGAHGKVTAMEEKYGHLFH